jgi:tetratricopeptide (TPR) repeat protein
MKLYILYAYFFTFLIIQSNCFRILADDLKESDYYNLDEITIVYNNELTNLQIGLDYIFREDFYQAEKIYDNIIHRYPNHAIGYFAKASLLYIQKDLYETSFFDSSITKYFSKVKAITELNLEYNNNIPLYHYLLGYIKLNESYIEIKNGNFLSAFFQAIDGIGDIEESIELDPKFDEPKFLIGSYIYFKNKFHSFFYDSRNYGIDLIKEVIKDKSNINYYFANSVLTNIMIDKEKFSDAKLYINKALDVYPNSRVFLYIYANLLFQEKEYSKSFIVYNQIEKIIKKRNDKKFRYGFNSIFCNYRKILSSYNLKNYEEVIKLLSESTFLFKRNSSIKENYLEDRLESISQELKEISKDIEGKIELRKE